MYIISLFLSFASFLFINLLIPPPLSSYEFNLDTIQYQLTDTGPVRLKFNSISSIVNSLYSAVISKMPKRKLNITELSDLEDDDFVLSPFDLDIYNQDLDLDKDEKKLSKKKKETESIASKRPSSRKSIG